MCFTSFTFKNFTGSTCHSTTLPALVRTPLMMQSTLDMKPFMSFPVDTTSPVGLFPNFNTMDPVQKAVINHTFGVSIPPKKKQVISCNICQLRFNSDVHSQNGTLHWLHTPSKANWISNPRISSRDERNQCISYNNTTSLNLMGLLQPEPLADVAPCTRELQPLISREYWLLGERSQAEAHYKGSKHAKKLKAQESTKNKQKTVSPKDNAKTITTSTTSTAVTANNSDKPEIKLDCLSTTKAAPPKTFTAAVHTLPTSVSESAKGTSISETGANGPAMNNGSGPAPSTESEEEKAKKLLYCSLCKVAVNSLSQLEAHNTGSKHKTMLEARNGAGPIKAYPRPGSKLKVQTAVVKGSGLQNKTFHCEICDVHVNSEIQLKQHISSRRHKDRVAGKPMKPKYSPYNKQQRNSTALAAKLAFQKDLVKPLSPAFISPPFSPTAVPSLSLHPRPNTSIFQTPALPPALLRAAPGPIRPTAGSILFAPY
ncbi:zinc finger protein 385B isoform X3 [Lepisosteus oculatus]|uniref:zinc finger protein 385B isoform X3 n=1 Tax=Lepisosteus oculatus TaxID=7918 RepID=UPI00074025D2|nr:PREDICTED: zinc finger protein 385B isoform X3 [Lepisosteus oculatus]